MKLFWMAWSRGVPPLALALVVPAFLVPQDSPFTPALAVLLGLALLAAVFAAVHHAEVVAHRVGEPLGTLVLAVAVTVIEVGLVVSIMLSGGGDKAALARDTVFAAVMIVCNGVVGLCLLVGGVKHGEQDFRVQGASSALAVLAALATLVLVLPNYTSSLPGPVFNAAQLAFAGVVSLVLYCVFVFVQTVRHPGYFLEDGLIDGENDGHAQAAHTTWLSAGLLVVALAAVVGLAKGLAPAVEAGVDRLGAPKAVVGVAIALLVLLPEALAAVRAARANRLQTSLNLALGSALASIGLTIPVVAAVSILLHQPLVLGLDMKETVLLGLTLLVGVLTLGTGRTTILQGAVHLVIFAVFLFLAVVP